MNSRAVRSELTYWFSRKQREREDWRNTDGRERNRERERDRQRERERDGE